MDLLCVCFMMINELMMVPYLSSPGSVANNYEEDTRCQENLAYCLSGKSIDILIP